MATGRRTENLLTETTFEASKALDGYRRGDNVWLRCCRSGIADHEVQVRYYSLQVGVSGVV